MAKRNASGELNEAVDALMTNPDVPHPVVTPRLAAILRVAGALRDLPSNAFKARLKADLLAGMPKVAPASSYGEPLMTADDIYARLAEIAHAPRFLTYDVAAALSDLPEMTMRFFASLNACTIGVSRGSTRSHWERHPAGDEMLYFLDGEADIVTLTEDGPVHSSVQAGSIFICPQGLWHQLRPRSPLTMVFATPGEGTQSSSAKDPRDKGRRTARKRRSPVAPTLVAYDVHAIARDLPELVITSGTTDEEADAAVRTITSLGPCTLGVMRYSGLTPWERHPDGDELLYPIAGAVDVTALTDDGPVRTSVPTGSVFVCPRGLWHRQYASPAVTMLFGTPTETSEVSFAEDPR